VSIGTTFSLANPTQATSTLTGTQNDFNFSGVSCLRLNNATDLTITGFLAGVPGQVLEIVSVGAGNVFLSHQSAGSAAANRLINTVTVGNTPLAGGIGTAVYVYDGTTARWRLLFHNQGLSITPTFAAGNFTGNGLMTVTVDAGDLDRYSYYVTGGMLTFACQIRTFTTGGTPNTNVNIALPGGFNLLDDMGGNCIVVNNGGTFEQGRLVFTSVTNVAIQRAGAANWANGVNNNELYCFPSQIPIV
jgi:hypothetical protein